MIKFLKSYSIYNIHIFFDLQYYNNLLINWGWDTTYQFEWINGMNGAIWSNLTNNDQTTQDISY